MTSKRKAKKIVVKVSKNSIKKLKKEEALHREQIELNKPTRCDYCGRIVTEYIATNGIARCIDCENK